MEELLRRFLWWFYMTKNKVADKWFSIKLDWLKWKYNGADKIPGEEIGKLLGNISETETAVLARNIRLAAIITDISEIRPMVLHGEFYKDLCVAMFSEDLAYRDEACTRVGYLFTRPFESRNEVFDELPLV